MLAVFAGVPICVTFSPDEKHTVLMLRLSRSRAQDPANEKDDVSRRMGGRQQPDMERDYVELGVPISDLLQDIPSCDNRRAVLARDGLASVDGFKIHPPRV